MATGTNIGSTKTLTLSVNTGSGVSNFTIQETSYPYMRAKTITFTVQGLKPNTIYYPFFAGTYVGSYCSTVNGQISSVIKTNAVGDIKGNFYMPGGTFPCGTHTFELVDNVRRSGSTPVAPDPLYGSVSAQYEAIGSLRLQQTQATKPKAISVVNNTTISTTNVIAQTNIKNSVNISNKVTNNVIVSPSAPKPAPIVPPPPVKCEEWYFDYQVVSRSTSSERLTVTTSSKTPSPNPWSGNKDYTNVSFVSTKVLPKGQYEHTYTATVAGKTTTGNRLRQTWEGPSTTATPAGSVAGSGLLNLTQFRPGGLKATDTVTIVSQWKKNRDIACPASFGLRQPTRVDPIAQSFFVDPAKFPQGFFITSIDLFFKTVDQSTPVVLEIRNMSNGLPGSTVLPHGTVLVPGYATRQSNNASVATRFTLDTPVFVGPGDDYCFVVKSSSLGYNLWCSRMGEKDVRTGRVIDTQPFGGTLFKSENDSTWIPDSYEDVKFIMRHAQFNTGITSNLIFRPQRSGANYLGTAHNLPLSFMSTVLGSTTVKIKCPLHGLTLGDKVVISGISQPNPVTIYNGIPYNQLNGTHTVTPLDGDEFTITVTTPAVKTGPIQRQDVFNNLDVDSSDPPDEVTNDPTDPVINTDTFTSSTITGALPSPSIPTPPELSSTTSFTMHTNILVNEIMLDTMATKFDDSTITEKIRLAKGYTNIDDIGVYALGDFIDLNDNGDFTTFDEPQLISSYTNELLKTVQLSNQPSATVDVKMSTTSKDVSPILDTNGMSLVVKSFKIDNQLDEIDDLRARVESGIGNQLDPVPYSGNGVALWADVAGTAVEEGLMILNAGNFYNVNNSGTLGSTAPTATSGTVTSGDVVLEYLLPTDAVPRYYKAAYNDDTSTGNSEINPGTGNALAKYKSVINTLDDSYDQISVFVSAIVPKIDNTTFAEIDVYVRTSMDEFTHMDRDWKWCPVDGDYTKIITPSPTRVTIDEFMFELDVGELFNTFDIKVVMRTNNSSFVPKIFGIRAIANKSLV